MLISNFYRAANLLPRVNFLFIGHIRYNSLGKSGVYEFMVDLERRTKQATLKKWSEPREKNRGAFKPKPTREYSGQTETKKESVRLFKNLLMKKPGRNVEIKVYWSSKRGKSIEEVLGHDSKKIVKGKEVIIEAPSVIEQIAMLSVRRGMPESIGAEKVVRSDWGRVGEEFIVDVNEEVKSVFLRESSTISNYSLADKDYVNVFLELAQKLDFRYANMSLEEIGKDLRRKQKLRAGVDMRMRID